MACPVNNGKRAILALHLKTEQQQLPFDDIDSYGYNPIDSYGMIGNCRSAALVGINGSIDWYCHPHFDSPSIFGRLLDQHKGGFFQICPAEVGAPSPYLSAFAACAARHTMAPPRQRQFYWPGTNILITRFPTDRGVAEIEDLMPLSDTPKDSPYFGRIFRRVKCIRGAVTLSIACLPALDYAREASTAHITPHGACFTGEVSGHCFVLSTKVPLALIPGGRGGVCGQFTVTEGHSEVFVFKEWREGDCSAAPTVAVAERIFLETASYWQEWLSHCSYRGRWREQVHRSILALKLLTFEPTGAMVAAITTSLPEVIGGQRNWDYRYCWLRDASFMVYAFIRLGFKKEAAGFMHFLEHYVAPSSTVALLDVASQDTTSCGAAIAMPPPEPVVGDTQLDAARLSSCGDQQTLSSGGDLQPIFSIHGGLEMPEVELAHLEGFSCSKPLADSMYLHNKYVDLSDWNTWSRLRRRCDWIVAHWQEPDDGIWEMRHRRRQFVFSKVMCWVALDRALRLSEKRSLPCSRGPWAAARDAIYEDVMLRGWSTKKQAFVMAYDCDDLDASLLILPLVFFIAPTDPRMLATIDAIMRSPAEGGLTVDGLVYRYPPAPADGSSGCGGGGGSSSGGGGGAEQVCVDGLAGREGTFAICSFWLVEALARAGRTMPARLAAARLIFERALGYASPHGLFAEQTGLTGQALGNYPQAFTHLSMISAAFNLDRALDMQHEYVGGALGRDPEVCHGL